MLLLLLLFYLSHNTSQGLTLSLASSPKSEALYPRLGKEFFDDRSVWAIVWSCVATLFACGWVAVHPNVPSARDSELRILGRRLVIMVYMILAPELIIRWAACQYFDAKAIAAVHKGMYISLPDCCKDLTETMAFRRKTLD